MLRREFLKTTSLAVAGFAMRPNRSYCYELPATAYSNRVTRARELMRAAKIDLLFIVPSRNMAYLSKINTGRSERLIALLLPIEGTPAVICPEFEEGRIR